jgi:hypothetical protein
VALLLRDRDATVEAAAPPPGGDDVNVAPPKPLACEACGSEMQRGQDWCLECGRAAPGRLGARPGWRAAFTVVGLTLLLVCCAVIASYAALTSKSERSAAVPSPASGQPVVPGTPPVAQPTTGAPIQPGPTGPGTTPPTVAVPPANGIPLIPVPKTATPPANTPVIPPVTKTPAPGAQAPATVTPPATGTAPATGTQTPTTATQTPTVASAAQIVPFKADAASTYDPGKRVGAEFGPAENAIDKKPDTVWDVVVPADGKPLGVGLLIKLGAPLALQSLKLDTPTPGFRVELYGAVDDKELPVDILDKRWIHLTDRKEVVDGGAISLKGKGEGAKFKVFMLYFTRPADVSDPRVAIGNVELTATL